MKRGLTGYYLPVSSQGESCRAFIPNPLPPSPEIEFDSELRDLLEKATLALGRLDGVITVLPEPALFLYMYIRKEAVLSSQIEGTQSSLSDLLLFELDEVPGVPTADVQEVSNYVAALNLGLKRIRENEPITLRLFREIHKVLLAKGRGSKKEPGEFRRSQNWVGGSRPGNATYVPPPPDYVLECLGALEKFLHNDPIKFPLLLKAGVAHVQFETIHPFLDGNGRLGRLLITFLFCADGALREPVLYLSLFFKQNRAQYYDLLQRVRLEGDWEAWLKFFLRGVAETAEQSTNTARALFGLFRADRETLQGLGRAAGSTLRVHDHLQRSPLTSVAATQKALGKISQPTVNTALLKLEELGMVKEVTGGKYSRIFAYKKFLDILNQGTEPLKPTM